MRLSDIIHHQEVRATALRRRLRPGGGKVRPLHRFEQALTDILALLDPSGTGE